MAISSLFCCLVRDLYTFHACMHVSQVSQTRLCVPSAFLCLWAILCIWCSEARFSNTVLYRIVQRCAPLILTDCTELRCEVLHFVGVPLPLYPHSPIYYTYTGIHTMIFLPLAALNDILVLCFLISYLYLCYNVSHRLCVSVPLHKTKYVNHNPVEFFKVKLCLHSHQNALCGSSRPW